MTDDYRAQAYLLRKIDRIKGMKVPSERDQEKTFFMVSTQVLAEVGFLTHEQRFLWNERMLREVG